METAVHSFYLSLSSGISKMICAYTSRNKIMYICSATLHF